jgi:hypothetical protein
MAILPKNQKLKDSDSNGVEEKIELLAQIGMPRGLSLSETLASASELATELR